MLVFNFWAISAHAQKIKILNQTFRENFQRNGNQSGVLPVNPTIKWRYPDKPMCGTSREYGKKRTWCGTGWTGQPIAYQEAFGEKIIAFGAYDYGIHFLNARTGRERYPTFYTKDLIKGTGTLHPDGLLSIGSRDNLLRVLKINDKNIEQLWSFNGNIKGRVWNNDWDASPILLDDYLLAGGENSWFFIFKLNKQIINGRVTINPVEIVRVPGFDKKLIKKIGDRNVSIENSPVIFGDRVYFANSGGLISGYNFYDLIRNPQQPEKALVFKFWAGDDIDATMAVDDEGMLYVGVEQERKNKRSKRVGQIIKLDPYKWNPGDLEGNSLEPLEWSVPIQALNKNGKGGVWASPAITDDTLYVSTHTGRFMAIDKFNGQVLWEDKIGFHSWSSPVITNNGRNLVVANCRGEIRNYSLEGYKPKVKWTLTIPGKPCIESTPLILDGSLYVGTRDGYFYAIGEK